ncbi:NDR1/HIN1-like protein 6 [Linum grandiflorum]
MDHRGGGGDSPSSSDPLPPQTSLPKYSSSSNAVIKPPPEGRRVPPRRPTGGGGAGICYKCVCCSFWFLLILALAGLLVFFYSILQPRAPSFSVQRFQVNAFEEDSAVLTNEIVLSLKSKNPNRGIGFIYGRGSTVSMWFNGTVFSSGKLPAFRQDPDTVTLMNVTMHGTANFGKEIRERLRKSEEEKGQVPLLLMFKAPVAVVIQSFPLREIAVFINGSLVVDSLSHPDRSTRILSSQYAYSIGL